MAWEFVKSSTACNDLQVCNDSLMTIITNNFPLWSWACFHLGEILLLLSFEGLCLKFFGYALTVSCSLHCEPLIDGDAMLLVIVLWILGMKLCHLVIGTVYFWLKLIFLKDDAMTFECLFYLSFISIVWIPYDDYILDSMLTEPLCFYRFYDHYKKYTDTLTNVVIFFHCNNFILKL